MCELTLTPDAKAVASRELRKLLTVAAELTRQVEGSDAMQLEHIQNLLGLAEFHFADAAKAIGVSSQSANTVAMRSEMLREARQRIQELEAFAADTSGAAHVREGVKTLSEKLSHWWRKEGLGYARDIVFADNHCVVKLGCSLSGDFLLMYSDTPVSDKERLAQWHAALSQAGLVLSPDGRSSEPDVIDCDQSREALTALIKKRLPTARIWSFECRTRRDGRMKLSSVEIHLRNYDEIDALPSPEKEQF